MTDRKNPGVAFWATVVLVVALAYPLSFGPVARTLCRFDAPLSVRDWANWFYQPLQLLGSLPFGYELMNWYMRLWI